MNPEEVQGFFERYRAAFDRLDGDAVADLWCGNSGIADKGVRAAACCNNSTPAIS